MLIGRDDAAAEALAALRAEGRFVLVGLGGVGKTSLARHVVGQLAEAETIWLDVGGIESTPEVLARLVDSLGDHQPSGGSEAQLLRSVTEGRRVAVVLDGVDVDIDEAIRFTSAIPTTGDGPWVVITSRRRPTNGDAPVVRLAPFDVSSDDGALAATTIFCRCYERAGGDARFLVQEGLLSNVVALSGGVPLALRVAAAAAAATGLDATVAGLARGRGLEDLTRCIDRSVNTLSSTARSVFDAVAVTTGRVDVDMVVAVSGLDRDDVVDGLGSLVAHNLLDPVVNGYEMLPPVHRYASERVSDAAVLWDRYRAWGEALADDGRLVLRHERDLRSIVKVLLDSCGPGDVTAAARLVRSLAWALFDGLLQHVAAEHIRSVLASDALQGSAGVDERIELLRLLAIAESESRGDEVAMAVLDEAERLLVDATNPDVSWARLASLRAVLLHNAGSVVDALELIERAGAIARARDDRFNAVQSDLHRAAMLLDLGRLAEADQLAVQVVEACDEHMASFAQTGQSHRAAVALERGDRALCEALGRKQRSEAATLGEAVDAEYLLMIADPAAHAGGLEAVRRTDPSRPGEWMVHLEAQAALAMQALVDGDSERAVMIASDIVVVAESLPLFWMRLDGLLLVGDAALLRADHRQAWIAYRSALMSATERGYALRVADAVDGLARLTLAGDQRDRALAASAAIRLGCDAMPRPRPWLPSLPVKRSRIPTTLPDGWVIDGRLSVAAIDHIVRTAQDRPNSVEEAGVAALSPAEARVARLVAQGCTNREIGERLHISRRTVETHIVHAFQKLGVHNRTQLATAVNAGDV